MRYSSKLLICLCLTLAIVLVYGQIIDFDFVGFDDELYVTENFNIQKGFTVKGLKWAFTTFHSANWHPITWLSHMLVTLPFVLLLLDFWPLKRFQFKNDLQSDRITFFGFQGFLRLFLEKILLVIPVVVSSGAIQKK